MSGIVIRKNCGVADLCDLHEEHLASNAGKTSQKNLQKVVYELTLIMGLIDAHVQDVMRESTSLTEMEMMNLNGVALKLGSLQFHIGKTPTAPPEHLKTLLEMQSSIVTNIRTLCASENIRTESAANALTVVHTTPAELIRYLMGFTAEYSVTLLSTPKLYDALLRVTTLRNQLGNYTKGFIQRFWSEDKIHEYEHAHEEYPDACDTLNAEVLQVVEDTRLPSPKMQSILSMEERIQRSTTIMHMAKERLWLGRDWLRVNHALARKKNFPGIDYRLPLVEAAADRGTAAATSSQIE